MKENNIYFVTVVPPDKHTIYPEHLPWTITKVVSNPRRMQRIDYLSRHSDVIAIDLSPPLLKGAKKYPVYFKADTHWNRYGSFIGYQEIMKELKKKFPNLDPLTLDDFEVAVDEREEPGDLSIMLAMRGQFADEDIKLTLKSGVEAKKLTDNKKLNKIVIYHDSFFDPHYPWSTIQYLKHHFNSVVDYTNNYAFDNEKIKAESPDVVIYELVERTL